MHNRQSRVCGIVDVGTGMEQMRSLLISRVLHETPSACVAERLAHNEEHSRHQVDLVKRNGVNGHSTGTIAFRLATRRAFVLTLCSTGLPPREAKQRTPAIKINTCRATEKGGGEEG